MTDVARVSLASCLEQYVRAQHSNQPVPSGSKTRFSLLHDASETWG